MRGFRSRVTFATRIASTVCLQSTSSATSSQVVRAVRITAARETSQTSQVGMREQFERARRFCAAR